jgi:hypothetical protein
MRVEGNGLPGPGLAIPLEWQTDETGDRMHSSRSAGIGGGPYHGIPANDLLVD